MIWRRVGEIVNANEQVADLPSAFWDFHQMNYAATQAIAIRRQADRDPRTCSLALLIKQMAENAEALTRESYVGLFDQDNDLMVQRGHAGFDQIADDTGDHLDPEVAYADYEALQDAAKHVRAYVDQHLAHDDAEPTVGEMLTFGDLHAVIDAIGTTCRKYAVALTAGWWATWEPVIQDDWEAIFRVPWLVPEATERREHHDWLDSANSPSREAD
jgi:hypothetical protein